ncbi:MAG TPA: class I SAM-dependent methyltransferase [Casimicrobiaceae bacterium]|nr:class I SAM-dependent methyltransferase [Casimicrobiaceae bacterium]
MLKIFGRARRDGSAKLVADVAAKFNVSQKFAEAYLDQQQVLPESRDSSYNAFWSNLTATQQMYIGFALTTTRGNEVCAIVAPRVAKRESRRHLDIGSGYGGFLRAFADAGFETVGVEILPSLAALSRANVADLAGARVIEGDFLTMSAQALGTFDCITCNDVIEHVRAPQEAMRTIGSLLRPGGVLYMEIPNRDHIGFVAKDGHFSLFGITTLPREAAARYYDLTFRPSTGIGYDDTMGDYLPLDAYQQTLRGAGIECMLLDRHVSPATLPALLVELSSAYQSWVDDVKPKLPTDLARTVDACYARYASRLYADIAELPESGPTDAFRTRYLRSFWSLIGTRVD